MGSGACRPTRCMACPAMGPMCRKTEWRPAQSCSSWATGRTSGWRSRCRRANVEGYRDAAVIAISQLREIYIDGQLELIETANWYPRVTRKDYAVGVTVA